MSADEDSDIGTLMKCSRSPITTVFINSETVPKRKILTPKADFVKAKKSEADAKLKYLNQKVFTNDLILDCIFGFLKLEDIKRFRQICRQWNRVALPFLKKLSLISFSKPDYSLQNFNTLFNDSQLGTDFTAIKLANSRFEWKLSEFTHLLEDRKINMAELTFDGVQLEGFKELSAYFYLRPYIKPSLTNLHITDKCGLIVSTHCCKSIKFLSLIGCRLRITSGAKINPVELTLKKVIVELNGNQQASSLNEFVNFDKLKFLSLESLSYTDHNDVFGKLSIHFRDEVTVEKVNLCGPRLNLDFKNAKWKVTEKFSLTDADFLEPNEMEISNFEINGGSLQLPLLPVNIKILKIADGDGVTKVLCFKQINLPELEVFHLLVQKPLHAPAIWKITCISHFNNCTKLNTVMLTIYGPEANRLSIDIANLPKSVQKLFIYGNIEFYGDAGSFDLKQLHVQWSNPYSVNSIIQRFKGEELALDLRCPFYSDSVLQTVMDISQKPFHRIVIGLNPQKQENNFKVSPISQITNKLSGFYIFANGFGNDISKSKFEKIFEFWEVMCQN